MPQKTFGSILRDLRIASNVRQAHIERELGRTSGWLSKVERGDLPAPGRPICERIGSLLTDPNAGAILWEAAAPERLDEDLRNWVEGRLARVANLQLPPNAVELMEDLRDVGKLSTEGATNLHGLVETLANLARSRERVHRSATDDFLDSLDIVNALPIEIQLDLLRAWTAQARVASHAAAFRDATAKTRRNPRQDSES